MNSASRPKIIPFPGVLFGTGNSFQNTLDDFLSEAGYIEDKTAPEVQGSPKNELEIFLREMGYVE
jgi:hypothetical protein